MASRWPRRRTTSRRHDRALIHGLQDWFAADPLAYVSGNEFLYFVEGDPRRSRLARRLGRPGIDKCRTFRTSYKTWEEGGKGPDLVVEVSSKSTRREDLRKKFDLYRDELKVREYFLFDPLGEYLKPPLKGYRLDRRRVRADRARGRPAPQRGPRPPPRGRERPTNSASSTRPPAGGCSPGWNAIQAEKAVRLRNRRKRFGSDPEGRGRSLEKEERRPPKQAEAEAERLRRMIADLQGGPKPKKRK